MATQKEITIKIKGDDGQFKETVVNSVELFEQKISEIKADLDKAPLGSESFKNLSAELEKTEGAFDEARIKAGGFGDVLAEQPGVVGALGQSFQGLKGGVKAVNTAFKALLANPIVAVIAAIAAALIGLYKAFTSTKEGAEKMDQIFAGISAAMDVLRDRVLKLGGAIVKFFTGDFKGAFEDAKGAVTGIGSEIANEFSIAANATKKLQQVEDAMRNINVERSKQNLLMADAKLKINDENLSYEERLGALEEVRAAEVRLAEQEAQLAAERYNALKALADLSDSSKEQLDELAAAEKAMYDAQTASKAKQKELFDQEKALRDRQRAEQAAAAKEREDALRAYNDLLQQLNLEQIQDAEQRDQKALEIEKQKQIESINQMKISKEQQNELLLELDEVYEQRSQAIYDQYREEEKEKEETALQEKRDLLQRDLDAEIELLRSAEELKTEELKRLLDERMEMELEREDLTENERALIRQQYQQQKQEVDQQVFDQERMLEEQRIAIKQKALDDIISIAGAESKVGKAALIAKQILNAKELIMEMQKTITFSSQVAARSTLAVAEGTAQTAKVGFPWNIPMLIAYAAQAVGIVKAIKDAVRGAKGDAGAVGGAEGTNAGTTSASFARGGYVRGAGSSTSDSIRARLSNGESVINAKSTRMFRPLLSAINEMGGGRRFASGGIADINPLSTMTSIAGGGRSDLPIKTYVVANEVTSVQQLERQAKDGSTL